MGIERIPRWRSSPCKFPEVGKKKTLRRVCHDQNLEAKVRVAKMRLEMEKYVALI